MHQNWRQHGLLDELYRPEFDWYIFAVELPRLEPIDGILYGRGSRCRLLLQVNVPPPS